MTTATIAPTATPLNKQLIWEGQEYQQWAELTTLNNPGINYSHDRECFDCAQEVGGSIDKFLMRDYVESIPLAYDYAIVEQRNRDHETALAVNESAPVISPADRDALAAQAQAELLGANAEQRAKLRTIVTERQQAQAEVERLSAEVARLSRLASADVSPQDERLTQMWVAAAREADRQGYCSVYDGIATTIGAPTRDDLIEAGHMSQTYDVRTRIIIETTITVTAGNEREAIEEVDGMSHDDIWERGDISSYDITSVDGRSAEVVEE